MQIKIFVASMTLMAILLVTATNAFAQETNFKLFKIKKDGNEVGSFPILNIDHAKEIFTQYIKTEGGLNFTSTADGGGAEGGWWTIIPPLIDIGLDVIDRLSGGVEAAVSEGGTTAPDNQTITMVNEAGLGDWFKDFNVDLYADTCGQIELWNKYDLCFSVRSTT
jgi:hypothetical protein